MIHADPTEERVAVRIVDALLVHALSVRASDIHIEPEEQRLKIRYRIDGILLEQEPIDGSFAIQVVTRVKVLAGMNTLQRRVPQDGSFSIAHASRTIDVRVATFPSVYGETMALRLLDRHYQPLSFEHLGLLSSTKESLEQLFQHDIGLFLVTGPTGSGKTTTLYAALSSINDATKSIITLEDPVEYTMAGITQGHVDPEAGFTFETGVRAMLRQDPDIMLVGEIRDRQTARAAIEAALTGHLVLSTLHTHNTTQALIRMIEMDIEPFLLKASLIGVLAQRLVRVVCSSCVTYTSPTSVEQEVFVRYEIPIPATVACVQGCDRCSNTGYYGRTGIFELLVISDAMRSLMHPNPDLLRMHAQAALDGMHTLTYNGLLKVADGITTFDELACFFM